MMMASNTDDTEQIRKEMTLAANFFDEVKAKYFADDPEFKERSWGMSSDYEIAIDCRSTMIRVGTAIFWSSCVLIAYLANNNTPFKTNPQLNYDTRISSTCDASSGI